MVRRRKKSQPKATAWQPWSEAFARLFSLTPASWSPPAQVHSRFARAHVTFTAQFIDDAGLPVKATIRVKRDAEGWFVSEQSLAISLKSQPERSAA